MTELLETTADSTTEPAATPSDQKPAATLETEAKALLEEFKNLGLSDVNSLRNVVMASQQTGRAWNEVGQLRKAVEDLQGMNRELQSQLQHSLPAQQGGYYGSAEGDQPMTKREFIELLGQERNKQINAYKTQMGEMQQIYGDPDFGAVGGLFQRHLQDPNTQMRLHAGQTTLTNEYNRLVRTFYRETAARAGKVVEQYIGAKGTTPPHVEANQPSTPSIPDSKVSKDKIKKITEGRRKGEVTSEQALEDLVRTVLPPDDPIFKI